MLGRVPRFRRYLVVTLSVLATLPVSTKDVALGQSGDSATPSEQPSGREHPELSPGDTYQDYVVAAEVPPRGHWVASIGLTATDGTQLVAIQTETDGTVTVFYEGDESAESTPAPDTPVPAGAVGQRKAETHLSSGNECSSIESNLHAWWWTQNFAWYFKANSVPAGMSVSNTRQAVRDATSSITTERNLCDIPDAVSATHSYIDDTTLSVNMDTGNTCHGDGDDVSVASFGNLFSSIYGLACIWGNDQLWPSGGTPDESDMKLNSTDWDWVSVPGSGCDGLLPVRSVTTHERGHTFGIAHVDPTLYPRLTMRDGWTFTQLECNDEWYWLGKGDTIGLESRY